MLMLDLIFGPSVPRIKRGKDAKLDNAIQWPNKTKCHADRDVSTSKVRSTELDPTKPVMNKSAGMGLWLATMNGEVIKKK